MTSIPAVLNPRSPKRMVGCELLNLAARSPEALVHLSEQQYQNRINAAADQVLASGCRVVMLTGPSAAGKTTSANKLAAALRSKGVRSQVLSLDDFYLGKGHYPKQSDGREDYECLEALNVKQVRSCLHQLAQTGVCDAPVFDFIASRPSPHTQHIDCTDGVAVIEGLHAFNPALTETLPQDAVMHIYASLREEYAGPDGARLITTRDVRLARRITRDCQFRGHDADVTIEIWPHVCQAEDMYIKKYKNRANMVLDTSFSCEVGIWEYYIDQLTANSNAGRLVTLRRRFAHFVPIDAALIPQESMLREFIGTQK